MVKKEAKKSSLELLALIHAGSVHVIEVGMLEGCQSRNASVRIQCDQTGKQVDLELVKCGCVITHRHAWELGEGPLEVAKFKCIRPVVLIWCTENLENFEDLVNFGVAHEEWLSLHHFGEDAPSWPEINSKRICFLAKEDFRAPIP